MTAQFLRAFGESPCSGIISDGSPQQSEILWRTLSKAFWKPTYNISSRSLLSLCSLTSLRQRMHLWGIYFLCKSHPEFSCCVFLEEEREMTRASLRCGIAFAFSDLSGHTLRPACLSPVSFTVLRYHFWCGFWKTGACACCVQVSNLPPSQGSRAME